MSTAHQMPERDDGHIAYVCPQSCDKPYCSYCEGGLFACVRCNSAEGATTSECPGVPMTLEQVDAVYAGRLDYINGEWIEKVSPHSPASYRQVS